MPTLEQESYAMLCSPFINKMLLIIWRAMCFCSSVYFFFSFTFESRNSRSRKSFASLRNTQNKSGVLLRRIQGGGDVPGALRPPCGRRRDHRCRTRRRAPGSPPRWPSLSHTQCSSASTSREGRRTYDNFHAAAGDLCTPVLAVAEED
jgi:hypothetical protein